MSSITTRNQSAPAALVGARPVMCPTFGMFSVTTYRHGWTKKHAVNDNHSQRAGTT